MISYFKLFSKLLYKTIKKDLINNDDYRKSYNEVSDTYSLWINNMGKHTDKIIDTSLFPNKTIKILDFACGTGYISRKLLNTNLNIQITAVDMSEGMLEKCNDITDNRATFICQDGIDFLKTNNEKYDVIYCGWALPYFNHKTLIQLFKKSLTTNGTICIISNLQGTLDKMEQIFLKVMKDNYKEVNKPMNIRFNLPNGKDGLNKWFTNEGFTVLESNESEEIYTFDTPKELLDWINKTGACAGTTRIFNNYKNIEEKIIEEIKRTKYNNGKYSINHKFAYGRYRLR